MAIVALSDRFGSYIILAIGFIVASVTTATLGVMNSKQGLTVLLAMCGFCMIGVQRNLVALSATLYPTPIRATGTGWASGGGRIGSFASPVPGGVLLTMHLPLPTLFLIVAVPTSLGALCILLMRTVARGPRRPVVTEPVIARR